MKKKVIFLCFIMAATSFALPINKPNLSSYEKQKRVGGMLGDFNNLTETFNYSKDGGIKNTVYLGPLHYSYNNNANSHIIGISKNITEYLVSKYYTNIEEYYKNKESVLKEYEYILNTYSDFLVKNKELELKKEYFNKISNDKNIIDIKYKTGKMSEIDYEMLLLEIENSNNSLKMIEQELNSIKNELSQYEIDLTNIEEFVIPEFDKNDIEKFVKSENEKSMVEQELNKQRKLYNLMPSIRMSADYDITNKSYGFSIDITKNFKLTMEDVTENNLAYNKKAKVIEYNDEIEKYNNLKNTYDFNIKKEKLMEKSYKIYKLKYDLGKISYKELLDEKIKLNTAIVETIKSKNNLAIYLLKRGI